MKKTRNLIFAALAALTLNATAQSLLTEQAETPAQRVARELLIAPAQTRDALINQLDDASQRLWSAPDPAAVLAALGPKAAALFAINAEFGQLVGAFLQAQGDSAGLARLAAIQARTPAVTIHQDGTVTINPTPTPSPEP
jgi:hypothetical protein